MIRVEEFRKSLGKVGDRMTEGKIMELREWEDKIAEVIFKQWLRDKNKPKETTKTATLQLKTMLK